MRVSLAQRQSFLHGDAGQRDKGCYSNRARLGDRGIARRDSRRDGCGTFRNTRDHAGFRINRRYSRISAAPRDGFDFGVSRLHHCRNRGCHADRHAGGGIHLNRGWLRDRLNQNGIGFHRAVRCGDLILSFIIQVGLENDVIRVGLAQISIVLALDLLINVQIILIWLYCEIFRSACIKGRLITCAEFILDTFIQLIGDFNFRAICSYKHIILGSPITIAIARKPLNLRSAVVASQSNGNGKLIEHFRKLGCARIRTFQYEFGICAACRRHRGALRNFDYGRKRYLCIIQRNVIILNQNRFISLINYTCNIAHGERGDLLCITLARFIREYREAVVDIISVRRKRTAQLRSKGSLLHFGLGLLRQAAGSVHFGIDVRLLGVEHLIKAGSGTDS